MSDGEDRTVQHGYGDMAARAQHNRLVFEEFKDGRGEGRWRELWGAYLEKVLSEEGLLDEASQLLNGWRIHTAGLGAKTFDPLRIPGGGNTDGGVLLLAYSLWEKACKAVHKSPKMCLEIVAEGLPFGTVDGKYKFMRGTARENMISCLLIYRGVSREARREHD